MTNRQDSARNVTCRYESCLRFRSFQHSSLGRDSLYRDKRSNCWNNYYTLFLELCDRLLKIYIFSVKSAFACAEEIILEKWCTSISNQSRRWKSISRPQLNLCMIVTLFLSTLRYKGSQILLLKLLNLQQMFMLTLKYQASPKCRRLFRYPRKIRMKSKPSSVHFLAALAPLLASPILLLTGFPILTISQTNVHSVGRLIRRPRDWGVIWSVT